MPHSRRNRRHSTHNLGNYGCLDKLERSTRHYLTLVLDVQSFSNRYHHERNGQPGRPRSLHQIIERGAPMTHDRRWGRPPYLCGFQCTRKSYRVLPPTNQPTYEVGRGHIALLTLGCEIDFLFRQDLMYNRLMVKEWQRPPPNFAFPSDKSVAVSHSVPYP